MPAASPLQGGLFLSKEDFPPLPSRSYASAVAQTSPIKPTYAESTRTKPFTPISNLPLLPDLAIKNPIVTDKDGIKAVIFKQEEVEASKQAFRYALVARFHGERPSVDTFERYVNSEWGLTKPAVVGLLNPRHIMLRMDSEQDFTLAWAREDNSLNNYRFTLFKWSEGILENKTMKRAVWIELQRLPVMYQLPSILEQIANNIGRFLRLDDRTRAGKHPIAPRLCVELDFAEPLPTEVWVGYETSTGQHVGSTQTITYDFTRSKCNYCKSTGHEVLLCPQRNVKSAISFKRRSAKELDKAQGNLGMNAVQKLAWVAKAQDLRKNKGKDSKHESVFNSTTSPQHQLFKSPSTLDSTPNENSDQTSQSGPQAITLNGHFLAPKSSTGEHKIISAFEIEKSKASENSVQTTAPILVPISNSTFGHMLLGDTSNGPTIVSPKPFMAPNFPSPRDTPCHLAASCFNTTHSGDNVLGDHLDKSPLFNSNNCSNAIVPYSFLLDGQQSKLAPYLCPPKLSTSTPISNGQKTILAPNLDNCSLFIDLSPFNVVNNSYSETLPTFAEPLQVIPSGLNPNAKAYYRPIFHSSGFGGTSWHNERRNYSKDKITLSSLFKEVESHIAIHTPPSKTEIQIQHNKNKKKVSWIKGDILSSHLFEHDIEESLLSPHGKPTVKILKYSKAYRMEGAKHVAWASKYFRDRVNFIDEMDKRQLEYWENNHV